MNFIKFFIKGTIFFAFLNVTQLNAETPKNTLLIGWDVAPRALDPRIIGPDANSQYLEELRFLPLIGYDENAKIKYYLAESVVPEGKLSWKVKLKKGIHFANGNEIKASDVVATYMHIIKPVAGSIPSPRKGAFDKVVEIKELSDYDLLFVQNIFQADFITNLTIGILPKNSLQEPNSDLLGKKYESGPYLLEKNSEEEIVLVENKKFDAKTVGILSPNMPNVKYKIIKDSTTRFAALVKGDVDLVQNSLSSDKLEEISKNYKDKLNITTRTQINTSYLGFYMKDEYLSKPKIRKAIALAIDKDEIIQFILKGMATKATGMFPESNPYFVKNSKNIEYDFELAKKLLDEADVKDPDANGPLPRFKITMKTPNNTERIDISKAIAAQLKKVGIEVNVEVLEQVTFSDQLNKGFIKMWVAPWSGFKDPNILEFALTTKNVPPNGANRGQYSNSEVDVLLENGVQEMILEKRYDYYAKAQKIIAEDLPYVFLWHKKAHVVTSKNIQGYKLYASGNYISITEVTKK